MTRDWSPEIAFDSVTWADVPDTPGAYTVFDGESLLYVGMAGRDGKGSLRRRLKNHRDGNMVNMLKQYLWFAIVQHINEKPASTPQEAAGRCREFMMERLSLRYLVCSDGAEARREENGLKRGESGWGVPVLNGKPN